MKKKNRKGAIPATLTWIVATLIILFILVIFLVFVTGLSLSKRKIKIEPELSSQKELISSEIVLAYLNSEIEGRKVKDYIGGNDQEEYNNLLRHSLDYFKKYNLLWRIYIHEPDKVNPMVITKSDWQRRKFVCRSEEFKMFTTAFDFKKQKYLVDIQVCKGSIREEDGRWSR